MNVKIALITAIGCLIAGFIAGWIVTNWRLSASIAEEKAEQIQSNADHFRDATKKINVEANQYVKKTYELKDEIDSLKKELAHAKKNHPIPADCRPDSDRLRILKDAVNAANRAAAGQ